VIRRRELIPTFAIALVSAAVVAVIGYSSKPNNSSPTRSMSTTVTVYATSTDGAPQGTARLDGSCDLGSSVVLNRPDAARCFTTDADDRGANLFDPCFRSTAGAAGRRELFVCPEDPWNDKARRTVVTVRGGAGTHGERPSSLRPWAVALANGQRCFAISGATGTTAGLRQNYQCFAPPFARNAKQPVGKPGGVILGDPDQRTPVWRALFTSDPTDTTFTAVEVRDAYE
jgi:hypothetical protein